MRLRRAALWVGASLAALAAAASAALLSFDLDAFRSEVADAVAAKTGRAVSFDGALSLSLSVLPKLVLEGVTLGNPPGMSRPEMARLGRLEARVRFWPLLQGRVEIVRLVLSGVDVLLERDAEGRGNWLFPAAERTQADSTLPRIEALLVERSVVSWRTASGVTRIEVERLESKADAGAATARFKGAVDGRRLDADAVIAAVAPRAGDNGPAFAARDLTLRVDDVEARGELTLGFGPQRPRLDGALALGALDLDRLRPSTEARRDGRLIPDVRVDGLPLDLVDLDVALKVDRIIAGGLAFDDLAARVDLAGGRLAMRDVSAALAQGRLKADAEVRARADGAAVAGLRFELSRAELAALAPGRAASGRIDAKADLRGEGRTLRALASTLSGEARVLGRDGRIAGRHIDLAAADLLRLLAPWTEQGADTRISCMLFATTIRQGRAQAEALVLDADRVLVTGTGTIDLGRERLDLKLMPRPKEASLFSLATPVNVQGPWLAPTVSADDAGLLLGAAGALLGNLVLPGVGFLLPFLSAGADDHPCAATLAPANAPRPDRGESGVGGLFRNLGRSIDRALETGR
jgi:uncharacterized protein involved in outer membrane biogenesis